MAKQFSSPTVSVRRQGSARADGLWQQPTVTLKSKGALALAINQRALRNGTFARVDLDPAIPVARTITGDFNNPNEPKKVIPVDMADGVVTVTCPKVENTQPDDDAYAIVVTPGQDPENPTEDFLAVSDFVKSGDFTGDIQINLDLSQLGVADGDDRPFDLYVGQGGEISNPFISNVYRFRIDKRKPGANAEDLGHVVLPDEYLRNGVTRAQIEADDGFDVKIVAYKDHAIDDDVSVVFTKSDGTTVEFKGGRLPPNGTVALKIPIDFFLANDIDGRIDIAPKAVDVAGNMRTGLIHSVDTLISGAPSGFQQILVPLHDDGLIDLEDARTPPEFIIPYYTTPLVGDRVRVIITRGTIVEQITLPVVVGADGDPVASGEIPTELIVQLGADTDGRFNFVIDYQLLRGNFTIPVNLPKTIECDLRASGWQSELLKGVVRGPNSTVDDVIVPEDSAGPLFATIPHLVKDGTEAFQTNDSISLFRANQDGSNPVLIGTATSATAEEDLTYPVPAGSFNDGSNYVYYENRRNTGDAVNTERSPTWVVTVTSSDRVPGAGKPIPVSIWLYRDARQRIVEGKPGGAQPSMNYRRSHGNTNDGIQYAGVILRVYHYANMAANDRILMTVNGYNNRFASGTPAFTETLDEYVVSAADAGGSKTTAIPEDLLKNELPPFPQLSPPTNEESRFADLKIPYETIQRLTSPEDHAGVGSIKVSFTVTNDAGTGESDPASEIYLDVDARAPGG
ncbi:hypothetical protein [Luteibacter sp. CQ10]|uniref:hypothetical protein n=1 Tax=Luteibacter sp. CQ10 TaxID=2805821 RepID=UPI0034A37069